MGNGISRYFEEEVAFEIDDELNSDFIALAENITLINEGLSSKSSKAILFIPILKSDLVLLGWVSLQINNCPDTKIHREKEVSIKSLDSFEYKCVDFIKIDV